MTLHVYTAVDLYYIILVGYNYNVADCNSYITVTI
jgi:hypothetical protein